MNKVSLKRFVEWIALNDEPDELNVEAIQCSISVAMISDLFGVKSEVLAEKIIKIRENENLKKGKS